MITFIICYVKFNIFHQAELLQLKPHPFICTRNFINKKVEKAKPTFIISVLKAEY